MAPPRSTVNPQKTYARRGQAPSKNVIASFHTTVPKPTFNLEFRARDLNMADVQSFRNLIATHINDPLYCQGIVAHLTAPDISGIASQFGSYADYCDHTKPRTRGGKGSYPLYGVQRLRHILLTQMGVAVGPYALLAVPARENLAGTIVTDDQYTQAVLNVINTASISGATEALSAIPSGNLASLCTRLGVKRSGNAKKAVKVALLLAHLRPQIEAKRLELGMEPEMDTAVGGQSEVVYPDNSILSSRRTLAKDDPYEVPPERYLVTLERQRLASTDGWRPIFRPQMRELALEEEKDVRRMVAITVTAIGIKDDSHLERVIYHLGKFCICQRLTIPHEDIIVLFRHLFTQGADFEAMMDIGAVVKDTPREILPKVLRKIMGAGSDLDGEHPSAYCVIYHSDALASSYAGITGVASPQSRFGMRYEGRRLPVRGTDKRTRNDWSAGSVGSSMRSQQELVTLKLNRDFRPDAIFVEFSRSGPSTSIRNAKSKTRMDRIPLIPLSSIPDPNSINPSLAEILIDALLNTPSELPLRQLNSARCGLPPPHYPSPALLDFISSHPPSDSASVMHVLSAPPEYHRKYEGLEPRYQTRTNEFPGPQILTLRHCWSAAFHRAGPFDPILPVPCRFIDWSLEPSDYADAAVNAVSNDEYLDRLMDAHRDHPVKVLVLEDKRAFLALDEGLGKGKAIWDVPSFGAWGRYHIRGHSIWVVISRQPNALARGGGLPDAYDGIIAINMLASLLASYPPSAEGETAVNAAHPEFLLSFHRLTLRLINHFAQGDERRINACRVAQVASGRQRLHSRLVLDRFPFETDVSLGSAVKVRLPDGELGVWILLMLPEAVHDTWRRAYLVGKGKDGETLRPMRVWRTRVIVHPHTIDGRYLVQFAENMENFKFPEGLDAAWIEGCRRSGHVMEYKDPSKRKVFAPQVLSVGLAMARIAKGHSQSKGRIAASIEAHTKLTDEISRLVISSLDQDLASPKYLYQLPRRDIPQRATAVEVVVSRGEKVDLRSGSGAKEALSAGIAALLSRPSICRKSADFAGFVVLIPARSSLAPVSTTAVTDQVGELPMEDSDHPARNVEGIRGSGGAEEMSGGMESDDDEDSELGLEDLIDLGEEE